MSRPTTHGERVRSALLGAGAVVVLAALAWSGWKTWAEASTQDWGEPGRSWLAFDFWTASFLATLVWWKALIPSALLGGVVGWFGRCPLRLCGRPGVFAAALGLGVVLVGGTALTRATPPAEAPNVLIVLVDTVRADHVSFYGYERETWPELGRLAEDGVVFENAITQAPWTKPTVGTLFTGLVPSKHGALSHVSMRGARRFLSVGREHQLLPEAFRLAGWDTAAVVHNANITKTYGFDQGFGDFLFVHDWRLRAPTMLATADRWLGRHGDRPWFLYVHLTDPHYPYDPVEEVRGTFDTSGTEPMDFNLNWDVVHAFHEGEGAVSPEQMLRLTDLYDEELLGVDRVLAPWLERIFADNPNTVVVLLGDHGDEFLEHDKIGHAHTVFDELMRVPLVLWGPGVHPGRATDQVRLLDVAPTLLELAGLGGLGSSSALGNSPQPQGASLMPMVRGEESGSRPAPLETGGDQEPPWHLRGIRASFAGRMWKLVREEDPSSVEAAPFSVALFDLDADPAEAHNLADARPEVVAALEALLRDPAAGWYVHPVALEGSAQEAHLSQEEVGNLGGLGYVDSETE